MNRGLRKSNVGVFLRNNNNKGKNAVCGGHVCPSVVSPSFRPSVGFLSASKTLDKFVMVDGEVY
jgi:hypothetical protein